MSLYIQLASDLINATERVEPTLLTKSSSAICGEAQEDQLLDITKKLGASTIESPNFSKSYLLTAYSGTQLFEDARNLISWVQANRRSARLAEELICKRISTLQSPGGEDAPHFIRRMKATTCQIRDHIRRISMAAPYREFEDGEILEDDSHRADCGFVNMAELEARISGLRSTHSANLREIQRVENVAETITKTSPATTIADGIPNVIIDVSLDDVVTQMKVVTILEVTKVLSDFENKADQIHVPFTKEICEMVWRDLLPARRIVDAICL